MARQIIAIGSSGNDGTGDTLRAGAIKINSNFTELYQDVASLGLLVSDSAGGLNLEGISFDQRSVVFIGEDSPNSTPADNNETYLRAIEPTKDNIISLPDSSGTIAFITDIPNKVSAFTNDAGYLTGASAGIDSAAAVILINDNSIDSVGVINLVDATYISNRINTGLDSYYASAHIDDYVTKSYLVTNNLALDSALVNGIINTRNFLDSSTLNQMVASLETNPAPNTDGSRSLGLNERRFSNLYLKTGLEIDSARLTYVTASDRLNIKNVSALKIQANNVVDSAIFALGNISGDKYVSLNTNFIPSNDSSLDLGAPGLRWKDLYLSGNTIYMGDSATITANGKGLDISLAVYDSAGVIPASRKQGHLVILASGDSNTGGPTLAFKDSDNGNYIRFSTSGFASGGGGGGF